MKHLIGDTTGLIHLIASCLALISGTMILGFKKGTALHKKIGYVYVVSMGVLIITAFMIFRLFGGWGIFHYTTLVSLVTILLGMVPIWTKRPINKWQNLHFSFMYWSVMGLYAAFVAEILTRVPQTPFFSMVGISIAIIMIIGGICFGIKSKKWEKIFPS